MEIGRFKPLLIGAIQTKYDEAKVSGDARRGLWQSRVAEFQSKSSVSNCEET